jgi:EmrB/QacA subfamily drug resistance transporter
VSHASDRDQQSADSAKVIAAEAAAAAEPIAASTPALAKPVQLDARAIRGIVFGVMLAMFLSALDQTIVATALPAIGRELNDLANLSWVVTAYLIAATAVTPLYGKLADIYGRRSAIIAGVLIFVGGSIACALARSMPMLILARAIEGLGGGGLIALSQTVIADIITPKERARYQAHFGAVFASANVIGAIFGGYAAQYWHWSLIFWINVPLGAAALAMTYRTLALLPHRHRRHRLDILGALLMTGATVMLLLGLTWGGTKFPWASAETIAFFVASAGLWFAFGARIVVAPEPFLPLSILRTGVVRNAILSAGCAMGALIGLSIYVPIYLQGVLDLSPSHSGLALMPLLGGAVIGATTSGRRMARVRHYKRMPLVGLSCGTLALTVLAIFPEPPVALLFALLLTVGIGCGSSFPVSTVALQNAVHPHQLGTATAALNFARQLSGAILVAGFGAILLAGMGFGSGEGRIAELVARHAASAAAMSSAFRFVFAAAAIALAGGLAFLYAMEERPLRERPLGESG